MQARYSVTHVRGHKLAYDGWWSQAQSFPQSERQEPCSARMTHCRLAILHLDLNQVILILYSVKLRSLNQPLWLLRPALQDLADIVCTLLANADLKVPLERYVCNAVSNEETCITFLAMLLLQNPGIDSSVRNVQWKSQVKGCVVLRRLNSRLPVLAPCSVSHTFLADGPIGSPRWLFSKLIPLPASHGRRPSSRSYIIVQSGQRCFWA